MERGPSYTGETTRPADLNDLRDGMRRLERVTLRTARATFVVGGVLGLIGGFLLGKWTSGSEEA